MSLRDLRVLEDLTNCYRSSSYFLPAQSTAALIYHAPSTKLLSLPIRHYPYQHMPDHDRFSLLLEELLSRLQR